MSRGKFDVARPPDTRTRVEHAVDLAERGRRGSFSSVPATHSSAEHFDLRVEVLHLVVQQRIVEPLVQCPANR